MEGLTTFYIFRWVFFFAQLGMAAYVFSSGLVDHMIAHILMALLMVPLSTNPEDAYNPLSIARYLLLIFVVAYYGANIRYNL